MPDLRRPFRPRSVLAAGLLFSSLAACTSAQPAPTPVAETPLGEFDPAPCAHLRGGPRGAHPVASDFGRAHALARYFGVEVEPGLVDDHLVAALEGHPPTSPDALVAYAAASAGVCSAAAETRTLGPARVVLQGDVAVVSPGTGDVIIPSAARAVAFDVRELPDGADASAALERAIAVATPGILDLGSEERSCNGQPDEFIAVAEGFANDVYACKSVKLARKMAPGTGARRPLAVLTSTRLGPLAARTAIRLRAAGAWLVGESVPAAVAESVWVGVGDAGLAVRARTLLFGSASAPPVPDVVTADVRAADPVAALATLSFDAAPPALTGDATRARIRSGKRPSVWRPQSSTRGDARAGALVAYGALRTFFPYYDAIEDGIDRGLDVALAEIEAAKVGDRAAFVRAIRRYAAPQHDGHAWVADGYAARNNAFAPLALVPVGDEYAVALSQSSEAKVGDVVETIDGVAAAQVRDELLARSSGSPQQTLWSAGLWEMIPARASSIVLRAADGTRHTASLTPVSAQLDVIASYGRAPGPLTDIGAPGVYYMSLDGSYGNWAPTKEQVDALPSALVGKRGLILDMRGYPTPVAWEVLASVAPPTSHGPIMKLLRVGPDTRTIDDQPLQRVSDFGSTTQQTFTGKVVVLTSCVTQSQAEHWLFFLTSTNRAKLVGGKTSGADGNITGVQMPGGFGMSFTGMIIRNHDGTVFHGRGIAPDVEVAPNVDDLRNGRDTVLLRGVAEL